MNHRNRVRALLFVTAMFAASGPLMGQQTDKQTIELLLQRLAKAEARIESLEARLTQPAPVITPGPGVAPTAEEAAASINHAGQTAGAADAVNDHEHMMEIPGGPVLRFRGFADIGFGVGEDSN